MNLCKNFVRRIRTSQLSLNLHHPKTEFMTSIVSKFKELKLEIKLLRVKSLKYNENAL